MKKIAHIGDSTAIAEPKINVFCVERKIAMAGAMLSPNPNPPRIKAKPVARFLGSNTAAT